MVELVELLHSASLQLGDVGETLYLEEEAPSIRPAVRSHGAELDHCLVGDKTAAERQTQAADEVALCQADPSPWVLGEDAGASHSTHTPTLAPQG